MIQLAAAYTIALTFLFLGLCCLAGFFVYDNPKASNCLVGGLAFLAMAYMTAKMMGI